MGTPLTNLLSKDIYEKIKNEGKILQTEAALTSLLEGISKIE
jgi:hypothetical protein